MGSNITSFLAKNLSLDKVINISPIPPSIENAKNIKVNTTPDINTIPCIKSVHNTYFNPPLYEYIIAITPITIISKLMLIPVN